MRCEQGPAQVGSSACVAVRGRNGVCTTKNHNIALLSQPPTSHPRAPMKIDAKAVLERTGAATLGEIRDLEYVCVAMVPPLRPLHLKLKLSHSCVYIQPLDVRLHRH